MTAEMPWLDPAFEGRITPSSGAACVADPAPAPLAYTLRDINGRDVRLSDYAGKVILLDFWATWCVPCTVEIPWLVEFQAKYGSEGLQVVGISVDEMADRVAPFARRMNMNYPVLLGGGHAALVESYGPIAGIPITVFISREGALCRKHIGIAAKDDLEHAIRALLRNPA